MNILILNCGSSSLSFKLYRAANSANPEILATGKARNVATRTIAESRIDWLILAATGSTITDLPTHRLAAEKIIGLFIENRIGIDAIGHRFVHGGTLFSQTARIDAVSLEKLRQCLPFAPIHNPNSFSVIEACLKLPARRLSIRGF